jgi:hypothetical protein
MFLYSMYPEKVSVNEFVQIIQETATLPLTARSLRNISILRSGSAVVLIFYFLPSELETG